ncbi:E7 protein [Mesocricetus auratus papillomavirus 1]|uniref:Protein E7 n=1 Tax=Mesocricetus auratus papillomavirus 1 TaxID=1408129 RepID=U6ELS6_9PAPI|nr:E7 protein [Mesocricetus auratus papillomavirus 1]CDI44926.1 E7 protein [Mesocricetus auratus papillomavirus 1]
MRGPENPRLISVEEARKCMETGVELALRPLTPPPPLVRCPEPAVAVRVPTVALGVPVPPAQRFACVPACVPASCLCEPDFGQSSLSPDTPGKEESVCVSLDPYKIKTDCPSCDRILRFVVAATPSTFRVLKNLLLEDLHFVCPTCVKVHVNDGR